MGTLPKGGKSLSIATERESFDAQLTPILDTAYRVASRMTRNADDAWDLIHDAALNAFRGYKNFEAGTNFKAWFFKILTNTYIRKYSKARPDNVSLDAGEAPELFIYQNTQHTPPESPASDPEREVLDKIDEEKVSAAIESLPEDYRMACALYLLEDLSYPEIADILQIPIGTVRSRIHRGRNLLQRALWDLVHTGESAQESSEDEE